MVVVGELDGSVLKDNVKETIENVIHNIKSCIPHGSQVIATLKEDQEGVFRVTIRTHIFKRTLVSRSADFDLRIALDSAASHLYRQIHKLKERQLDRRRRYMQVFRVA